jgi:hypothetical protein
MSVVGGDEILVEVTGDVQARATLTELGTVKHRGHLGNNLGMPGRWRGQLPAQ